MKRIHQLAACLIISVTTIAQKAIPDFGKIDKADLQLNSCSFQPGAHAMKLFDVQEIEFEPDEYVSKLITERRVRIKVFNEKGFEHASITIPYYSRKRSTKFKDLSGMIYNLDAAGNIVVQKLEKKDFFKEKAEDNIGVIHFTFPNLKPGSVVEFRYKKVEKDIFQIDPWIVQDDIPVAYASTVLITPDFARIKEKISGADTLEQKVEHMKRGGPFERDKRTYYRENIRSFEREPFMSSTKDNLLRVIFLLLPRSSFALDLLTGTEAAWKFNGLSLMRSEKFGGQIKKSIPGTEKLIDSAKAIADLKDRIVFLYKAVRIRISEKGEQTLYPGDLAEAWETKNANTAETNLILLNLLKKAGITAYPILVSTREHGKVDMKFPSIGQMNGVDIVAADSLKAYVLDASQKFQTALNPPMNVLNRNAYLLNEEKMEWVVIDDNRPLLKQNTVVYANLKDNGMIEGVANSWHYDFAKSYLLDTAVDNEDEDRFYDKKPTGLKIISNTSEDFNDDNKPLHLKTDFTYEPQQTEDFYFINPQLFMSTSKNPFSKETRNTDIDFGCNQELNLRFTLAIPAGFQPDFLPKNIIVRAPDSSFIFTRIVAADENNIVLRQNLEIKQAIFYRDQYPGIQEFFKRIYALMNEEIILKKKK